MSRKTSKLHPITALETAFSNSTSNLKLSVKAYQTAKALMGELEATRYQKKLELDEINDSLPTLSAGITEALTEGDAALFAMYTGTIKEGFDLKHDIDQLQYEIELVDTLRFQLRQRIGFLYTDSLDN